MFAKKAFYKHDFTVFGKPHKMLGAQAHPEEINLITLLSEFNHC